jgi:hypothetical protein
VDLKEKLMYGIHVRVKLLKIILKNRLFLEAIQKMIMILKIQAIDLKMLTLMKKKLIIIKKIKKIKKRNKIKMMMI